MDTQRKVQKFSWILGITLVLLSSVTTGAKAPTQGIIPPEAQPLGYSLADAAAATAYFNTGSREPATLPEDFPFQMLYVRPDGDSEFSVKAGTMFYIPIVYSDDMDAAYWPYPDVTDPAAVSDYYFSPGQLGAEFIRVVVDGEEIDLGPGYAAGAVTPGLPTGANNYTVVAAFLAPLSKGVHSVTIAARLSGAFIESAFGAGAVYEFEIPYTVIVQ